MRCKGRQEQFAEASGGRHGYSVSDGREDLVNGKGMKLSHT